MYCAPELLQNREQNRRRGMDQNWVRQTQNRRQSGDIYAFGMVCYEILFRSLPFPDSMSTGGMFDTNAGLFNYFHCPNDNKPMSFNNFLHSFFL